MPTHPDAAQGLREAGVVIGHSVLIVVDIDREGDLSGYGIARPPVASNPHNDGGCWATEGARILQKRGASNDFGSGAPVTRSTRPMVATRFSGLPHDSFMIFQGEPRVLGQSDIQSAGGSTKTGRSDWHCRSRIYDFGNQWRPSEGRGGGVGHRTTLHRTGQVDVLKASARLRRRRTTEARSKWEITHPRIPLIRNAIIPSKGLTPKCGGENPPP